MRKFAVADKQIIFNLKNTLMKNLIKITLMLLVAMLTFNTAAEAQLGGLLNKAKDKVTGGGKREKEINEMVEKCKARIPQLGSSPNTLFFVNNKGVAAWDGSKNELTITTDMGGNTPGTVLKVDPTTGKVTDASGKAMGSLGESSVETPGLGTLTLKEELRTYRDIKKDGNIIEYGQKTGGYTIMRNGKEIDYYNLMQPADQGNKVFIRYNGQNFGVQDKYVGAALPAYVLGVVFTAEDAAKVEKDALISRLGYDPDKKYTMAELEDLVQWKDEAAEYKVRKYETSHPYAGFSKTEHPELKNVKIGDIALCSEWRETKEDRSGYAGGSIKWYRSILYWVIYELEDGRNFVGLHRFSYVWSGGNENEVRDVLGLHELTDYKRK